MIKKEMEKINTMFFNRKKIFTISLIVLVIIVLIVLISLYLTQKNMRDWIDINILRKNLTEDDTQIINLDTDKSNQIHIYNKYVAILNDKTVNLYNSYGEKVTSIDINIGTAVFDSADKYFAIGEKDGHEFCLILDKNYLWSDTVEGEILQVHVNRNGYVAIITEDVNHKSILTCYNSEGKKLFTSYFASTRIIDASISNDNKYIAIGELDTSGTVIKSTIKILSIKNAQNEPKNTMIYTYNAEDGTLITNVKYQEKGQILCVYDNEIDVIKNEENSQIIKIENDNITFVTNNLKNDVVYIEEENLGLFKSKSNINIINSFDRHKTVYELNEIAKEIYSEGNIIAVNTGAEIYFINTSGWLVKKYTAKQEITNVEVSDNMAIIVYKDKIVIVNI